MNLWATKSIATLRAEADAAGEHQLKRALGPLNLITLGIGAIIGAGIFVITGRVAANDAGPGVLISYAVAGLACALAALCYAEFASMAPVAGSAYTYAYATLGELLAWIIGWDLILEYAMSAATVAADWTKYFNKLLKVLHALVDRGNTVIVIEHNLDVVKTADRVIDLGPEGGARGGELIGEGTPEEIAALAGSATGRFLRPVLAAAGVEVPEPGVTAPPARTLRRKAG